MFDLIAQLNFRRKPNTDEMPNFISWWKGQWFGLDVVPQDLDNFSN